MKTIKFTFLLIAILLSITCLAQQEWDMAPQPPDAASFSTYGTFPVSYYTGTPDISIPLFTLDEGEIDVPITLSYNGRGVRVADESTWVGLGWNLYPGGSISRVVMGSQYDNHDSEMYNLFLDHWQQDYDTEYLKKCQQPNIWGTLTEGHVYNIEQGFGGSPVLSIDFSTTSGSFFESNSLTGHMFQPDIFTFNFLGYSGKFYINPETNKVVILDKKEHLIIEKDSPVWNPEINGWKAILPNGIVVYFQDIEKVRQSVVPPECSASAPSLTWKISKIEQKSGEEINFLYSNTYYETASISDSDIHAFEDDNDYNINFTKTEYGSFDPPYLFNDCPDNGRPVTISNHLKTLSQIVSPKYTLNFSTVAGVDKPRLVSLEITENCDPSFSIGYNFSLSPFNLVDGSWNQWTSSNGQTQNYGNAVNFVKYKLNHLQKYTKRNGVILDYGNPYIFEYIEDIGLPSFLSFAQDYWGYYNGQHSNKGLIPDESQMYAAGPYPVSTLPNRHPGDDLRARANSNRGASPVHMKQGILSKIVYPTGGYTKFQFEPHKFYLSDQDDYILLANEINYNGLHYYKNYSGSSSAISTGAGLRIVEISNYDYDNIFISRKKFNYAESGILHEPIHFWRIEGHVNVITSVPHIDYLISDALFYYKVWTASSSNHNQSFLTPNSVGYSYVEITESDSEFDHENEKLNGRTVYKFHNHETVYNLQLSRVSAGYLDARNGLPRSIEYLDNLGITIKKVEYEYLNCDNSMFLSMAMKHVNKSPQDGFNVFKIEYTPMYSAWWKQSSVIERFKDFNVQTTNEYSADVHGNSRLINQSIRDSKGQLTETRYFYAQDNPQGIQMSATVLSEMISKNMIEIPIKTEKYHKGTLIEGTIINYGINLFPYSTMKYYDNEYHLEQEFQYENGRITQYSGKDGVTVSFLWGCNYTKPIAKAIGTNYNTLNTAFNSLNGNLNALNSYSTLSGALITTFTYEPLSGLESKLDQNGIVTNYEYDDLGRLKLIKDEDDNILQHYQYHYKGQ